MLKKLFIFLIILLSLFSVSALTIIDVADYYTEGEINNTFIPYNYSFIKDNITALKFNIDSCTNTDSLLEGTLCWNPDQKTLNIVRGNGQVIQVGKEMGDDGINKAGITLDDGDLVCMNGFQGDNPTFIQANASDTELSAFCGILTTDCENNALCPVTVFGFVNDVNTSAWTTGQFLYSDPNNVGKLTTTMPEAWNDQHVYGIVGRVSATVGTIFASKFINPSNGFLINNIYATGNVTVQEDFTVDGNSIFNNDVQINGNIDVTGTVNGSKGLFGDGSRYVADGATETWNVESGINYVLDPFEGYNYAHGNDFMTIFDYGTGWDSSLDPFYLPNYGNVFISSKFTGNWTYGPQLWNLGSFLVFDGDSSFGTILTNIEGARYGVGNFGNGVAKSTGQYIDIYTTTGGTSIQQRGLYINSRREGSGYIGSNYGIYVDEVDADDTAVGLYIASVNSDNDANEYTIYTAKDGGNIYLGDDTQVEGDLNVSDALTIFSNSYLKDDVRLYFGNDSDGYISHSTAENQLFIKTPTQGIDISGRGEIQALTVTGKESALGNAGYAPLEVHISDDDFSWTAGFFNDIYDENNPSFTYYGYDNGDFAMGTEVATSLLFYTNGYPNERLEIDENGDVIIKGGNLQMQTGGYLNVADYSYLQGGVRVDDILNVTNATYLGGQTYVANHEIGTNNDWGDTYLIIQDGDFLHALGGDSSGDEAIYWAYPNDYSQHNWTMLWFGDKDTQTGFNDIDFNFGLESSNFMVGDSTGGDYFTYTKDNSNPAGNTFVVRWDNDASLFITPEYASIANLHFFNNDTVSFGGGDASQRYTEIYSNNADFIINVTKQETNATLRLDGNLEVNGNISATNGFFWNNTDGSLTLGVQSTSGGAIKFWGPQQYGLDTMFVFDPVNENYGIGEELVFNNAYPSFALGANFYDDYIVDASGIGALSISGHATGFLSTAIGSGSEATGKESLAIGIESEASGDYSVAIGENSIASSQYGASFGYGANSTGGVAIGKNANSKGGIAIGTIAEASGGVAIGLGAEETGTVASIAIGQGSHVRGSNNVAIGLGAQTDGNLDNFALGPRTLANGSRVFVIGAGIAGNLLENTIHNSTLFGFNFGTQENLLHIESNKGVRIGATSGENITMDGDDLYVAGNTELNGFLVLGNNGEEGLGVGDINASTIYYDTLTAKSPIFQCSETNNWCSVTVPEYQEILYLQYIPDTWDITSVSFRDVYYTPQEFYQDICQVNEKRQDICDQIKEKVNKLKAKKVSDALIKDCLSNDGYLIEGVCYKTQKNIVTYEEAVETYNKQIKIIEDYTCTQLGDDLTVINSTCQRQVDSGKTVLAYRFKENCGYDDNNYFCTEEVSA